MPAARPWPFVAVVLALLALLALLSLAGGSAVGSTEVRPRNAGPEAPSVDRGALRAARHREERARVARSSPRRRAVRRRSRAAYALQSDRRALSTLRHRFGRLLNRRPSALPHRRKGERLGRFVSDVAVEITNGERSALVESMLPMRTRNDRGRMAAVDLGLRDRGRSFVLANPLVDVRVSERIDGGVRLVDAGVGVAAVAANGSKRPRVVAGKLLWPNVDADTDFAVEPTVTGFETFHFLRSARSPERLSLELDLSDGASVRAVTGNTGAFEIVRDGVVVATISAPVAFDAAGDTVSVTAALEHGRLVLSVPHRRADVEYPIAVDPVIDGVVYDNYAWNWESKTEYNGWKYNAEVRPFHPSALDPCDSYVAGFGWGKGLYICSDRSQTYTTNAYAQWLRRPYGHETTIYRADFHDMNHQPSSYSQYVAGIWSDSKVTWDSPPMGPVSGAMSHWSTTNCARNPCPDLNDPAVRRDPNRIGTRNNVAVFRYIKHSGYGFVGNAHLGNAHIYQWDVVQPTFPNPAVTYLVGSETSTAPSTAWHRNAQLGARPSVTDYGLGIRKVELLRGEDAATATPFGTPDATPSCLADPNNKYREPCPGQFATTFRYSTAQLGEGIHTLRARARDYSHNERLTTAWTTKVDSSAPEFEQDPDDFPGQVTNLAETVEVTAADGDPWGTQPQRRSGVKRIDVYLTGPDGVRRHVDEKVASTPACTVTRTGESKSVDHSCPLTMQYTFPRGQDEYRPGEYAAEFVATDWAGNVSLPAVWSFHKLDILDPEITALKHTPDPLPRGWLHRHRAEVFADAWDPGFSGLYELDFTEPLLAGQQAQPPYRYRSILDKTQPCEGNLTSPCPIRSRDLLSGDPEGTRSYDTDRWREGIVTASLQVRDAAGHTSKPPSTFQLKVDRSPPVLDSPTGALWVHRNRDDDHRFEGVYEETEAVSVVAHDGSETDRRSGVKQIKYELLNAASTVVNTQTVDGTCHDVDGCGSDLPATFTLRSDDFADGEYKVRITAVDQLDHPKTLEWDVTIDRRGDIFFATSHDGGVAASPTQREEWAQLGTQNSRVDDGNSLRSRRVEPCAAHADGCATLRDRLRSEDSEELRDDDVYTVTVGATPADPRLRPASALLTPANTELGTPSATGPIADVLEPAQRRPPTATEFARYDHAVTVVIDEAEVQRVERLWVDRGTLMPVRRTLEDDGVVREAIAYSYARSRTTAGEHPTTWFAVEPGAQSPMQRDELGPEQPMADGEERGREEEIAIAREQRAGYGMRTDEAFVSALYDNPATFGSADVFGFPVSPGERAEFETRAGLEGLMRNVDAYGATHPGAYAGVEIGEAGTLIAHFTHDAEAHLAALRAQLSLGSQLVAAPAEHSLTELRTIEDRIGADLVDGSLFGTEVVGWRVDLTANRVVIEAVAPDDAFRAAVSSAYGPSARVDAGQPATPLTGSFFLGIAPVRGGQLMERPNGFRCSLSFPGQTDRGGRRIDVALTNAHCGPRGTPWFTGRRGGGGSPVPTELVGKTYAHVGHLDIGFVDLSTWAYGSRNGAMYVRTAANRDRFLAMDAVIPTPPGKNARVCIAAGSLQFPGDDPLTYGRNICGEVLGYVNEGREPPRRAMAVDLDGDGCKSLAGSSGSPVYWRNRDGEVFGVGVLSQVERVERCPIRSGDVVLVATLGDIIGRNGYAPHFRG